MTKIRTNGVLRDMTVAEEEQHTKDKVVIQAKVDAIAQEEIKKASGKQKLKDLGLDDDEIQALTGV